MKLTKETNTGTIELISNGIKLNIDPIELYKETISNKTQMMLDIMLLKFLKKIFEEVCEFYNDEYLSDKKGTDVLREQVNNYNCVVTSIEDLAHFQRQVIKLASEPEELFNNAYDKLSDKNKIAIDWAISFYKYRPEYGFSKTEKVEI
jgi:6-pyruvoyl-tetrahydropterin synthase